MTSRPYAATVRGFHVDDDSVVDVTFTVVAGTQASALRRAITRAVFGRETPPFNGASLRHPFHCVLSPIGYDQEYVYVRRTEPDDTVDARTGTWYREHRDHTEPRHYINIQREAS